MKYSEIFKSHDGKVSDKWNSYLGFYDNLTDRIEPRSILEIGVQNGGSLEIWAKKYPEAELVLGLDIDPLCGELSFESKAIKVIVGDSSSAEMRSRVAELSTGFDLIVDDGSHKSSDIISSLVSFLPILRPGGAYVVEDLHASYWTSWEGGLSKPDSAMNFLKRLADVVNFEHWGLALSTADHLSRFTSLSDEFSETVLKIKSVTFENSICIIELSETGSTSALGRRHVTGSVSQVSDAPISARGTFSSPEVSTLSVDELVEKESLHSLEIAELRHQSAIDQSRRRVAELELELENLGILSTSLVHELEEIKHSRIWRWTAPLRRFG